MQFVGETTGTDYTGNSLNKSSLLTDEEKAALRVLSDIVWAIK